jgi:transposase
VALSHGVNANLVHKWIRLASRAPAVTPAFVPVAAPALATSGRHIEIRLSRGPLQATVQWPVSEPARA